MAVISPEFLLRPATLDYRGILIVRWAGISSGDTCEPIEMGVYNERSVQATGTFGSGGIELHGSLGGSYYEVLRDDNGVSVDMYCAGVRSVRVLSRYAKPVLVGADGTTDLAVIMMLKGL